MWNAVHDGRTVFVACMHAMCSPGQPVELPSVPKVVNHVELDGAAAILLALLDQGLSLGVAGGDGAQRAGSAVVAATGARSAEIEDADWVLVHGAAADAISRARRGGRLTPESGATVVIAASSDALPMSLIGPGVAEVAGARAIIPLDAVAVHAFTAANAAPPRGVDVLVVAGNCLIGLPRSVSVRCEAG